MKENDIEEARERLEKRIKDIWFSTTYSQEQEEKDLKILLSDYKRVLKENEHKTEKIENQKAELAILNEKQKDFNKLQNTLSSYKGQFRRQEKENESLKKDIYILSDVLQWLKYYWVGRKERGNEWIQKIKEEIGKLEEMNVDGEIFTTAVNFAILTLQELIEEREEK